MYKDSSIHVNLRLHHTCTMKMHIMYVNIFTRCSYLKFWLWDSVPHHRHALRALEAGSDKPQDAGHRGSTHPGAILRGRDQTAAVGHLQWARRPERGQRAPGTEPFLWGAASPYKHQLNVPSNHADQQLRFHWPLLALKEQAKGRKCDEMFLGILYPNIRCETNQSTKGQNIFVFCNHNSVTL